jgi:peptide/nickel transport system substrate-binding protein
MMRVFAFVGLLAAATATLAMPVAAQTKDSVVLAFSLEPPMLDPTANAAAAINEVVYQNIFQGLTRITANGDVAPGLAESWTVTDDKVYRFKLRSGVKFHDGKPFDASVVKFSYDRARAADSTNPQKPYFAPIESVTVVDPLTVEVRLSRVDGLFLANMGSGAAVMIHPDTAATNRQTPIGTGPFKFERQVPGDRVILVRNPDYWGTPARLARVEMRVIADPAAQTAALLSGDVDVIPLFGAYEAVGQFRNNPRFQVVVGSTEGETVLAMNNAKAPFNDVRVRKAIQHAIDRNQLIEGTLAGFGTPIGSHFAPHRNGYIDLTGVTPYDPAKAKALLREAGFPNGFEATLRLPPPAYARKGGELVQAFLGEVGIKVKIEPYEWAQWLDVVFRKFDYDMTIIAHVEPMDIPNYARESYYWNYKNPKFNETVATLNETVNEAKRLELYGQLQRILAEDQANGFLFQLPKVMITRPNLVGMWKDQPVFANDMSEVYWR